MNANYLTPRARVRADGSGWGTTAIEPIKAGETVAAFGGQCVSSETLDRLAPDERAHTIQIDEDLFMVSPQGAPIGHSCQPNCGIAGGVVVVAMRDIAAGETISFDHAMTTGSSANEFECGCGTPACRNKVTGTDWMLPELQLAYRGYFSPYLAKRIASLVRTGAERRAFAL